MDYFYTVEITGGRTVKLRELSLEDYKNLQKACLDRENFCEYFLILLNELSVNELPELNPADIFIVASMMYYNSVSDIKTFYSYIMGKEAKLNVDLSIISNKVLEKYNELNKDIKIKVDNFLADYIVINPLENNSIKHFIKNDGSIIPFTKDIEDYLPAHINLQIHKERSKVKDQMNIDLFKINLKTGNEVNFSFIMNEIYVFDLINQILRSDLSGFYKNLYDLKTKLGIGFSDHKYITFAEYEMYIVMYNVEQQESEENDQNNSPLPKMPNDMPNDMPN